VQVGENRIVSLDREPEAESGAALIVQDDGTFRHERLWRGSAVALPVFALRSKDSVGAGEFADLKKLVTLCHQAGKSNSFHSVAPFCCTLCSTRAAKST
jgi:4-alpha-glucanotransferase